AQELALAKVLEIRPDDFDSASAWENAVLEKLWSHHGILGRPISVTLEDRPKLLAAGHIPIVRIVAGVHLREASQWAEQFRAGTSRFVGDGYYGRGHYFSPSPGEKSPYPGKPNVVVAYLHRDAHVIDYERAVQLQAEDVQRARQRGDTAIVALLERWNIWL